MKDIYDEWISPTDIPEEKSSVTSSRFSWHNSIDIFHKYQNQLLGALKLQHKK